MKKIRALMRRIKNWLCRRRSSMMDDWQLAGLDIIYDSYFVPREVTETLLVNSGIQEFARFYNRNITVEPAEDEDGPFAFLVV